MPTKVTVSPWFQMFLFSFNFELNFIKYMLWKCLAQIWCVPLQNLRLDWGYRADRQGGQVINLEPPNTHLFPYLDVKEVCHTQPWPSHHVSWPTLTFPLSQMINLNLVIVHIWYIMGVCYAPIFSKITW